MTTGRELRDAGINQTLMTEGGLAWRQAAYEAIDDLAARSGSDGFTAEDVRSMVGDPPGSANQMGAVFRSRMVSGGIKPVAFDLAQRPSSHAGTLRRWMIARREETVPKAKPKSERPSKAGSPVEEVGHVDPRDWAWACAKCGAKFREDDPSFLSMTQASIDVRFRIGRCPIDGKTSQFTRRRP